MSAAKIQNALEKEFAKRRIIFWYDPELIGWEGEFNAVELPGVEKITVQKNELAVKHRIAREAPRQKFLLYFRGQRRPADKENWLLDQLVAHGPAFSPDRASLALIDAGLPPEFKSIPEQHFDFFRNSDRVQRLREWLKPTDSESDVRLKMLAIVCRTEPGIDAILLSLLAELALEKSERWTQIEKFDLSKPLWNEISSRFNYSTAQPTLLDLMLCLFRSVTPLGGTASLNQSHALLFLNRWKDSQDYRESFETLSNRADSLLNITAALNQTDDIRPLLTQDAYRRIDLRILADLRDGLLRASLPLAEVRARIDARSQLHWSRYDQTIKSLYSALSAATQFLELLPKLDLTIESFDDGLTKYSNTWWQADQLYRQFIFHFTESGQTPLLQELASRIEGLYINEFQRKLSQRWQEWVDRCSTWSTSSLPLQREFFARFVIPQISDGRKVFVIISDALRFEAGQTLLARILQEDRWTATIKPMFGVLPSFTQLGMASLLPHKSLALDPKGESLLALADATNTAGTEARESILSAHLSNRGAATSAEKFLALNSKTEGRDLAKANDVVFIYHNTIDTTGDKRDTEHKAFAAVETAVDEIVRILKKAAAMNVSHFVITADHGFLYQNEPVADADFLSVAEQEGLFQVHRRFVVGAKVPEDNRFKCFTSAQLGLSGNLQFAFPKGIQRIRIQGRGSRYVHGGATLQEIVLPVLEVKKERVSDVQKVDVDIVRSGQQITTGQVTITFLQTEPIGEKCLPRELRVAFFSKTGVQLSESKVLKFDSAAEDARQRERREQFVFAREADQFNQQEVVLRLEEPIAGTTQFAPYAEFTFKLRRAFESDFDDF